MEGPKEVRPLMSKWKEHWETRDQIFQLKPETANKIGMGFFWCFSLSLLISTLNIFIPAVEVDDYEYEEDDIRLVLKVAIWFCYVETVINWIMCARYKLPQVKKGDATTQSESSSPSVLGETKHGWRFCAVCQVDAPPRSHHCKVCGFCILKHDHHCYFTTTCIGYANQRYFVVWLFYVAFSSVYILGLMQMYLREFYPLTHREGFNFLLPVAAWNWLCGSLPSLHLLIFIQLNFTVVIIVSSGAFFIWQMCMIYRGQTGYEASKGCHVYRVDPITHFRTTFGSFWILNFIYPLPTTKHGDGVNWQMHKNLKGH